LPIELNISEVVQKLELKDSLTVRGPSISGHVEGSARSPLPPKADCKYAIHY